LFSLFILDMIQTIEHIPRIKVNNDREVHGLLYADDTAITTTKRQHLQRKINALDRYFEEHGLRVNLDRTNVVIFRKGGRVAKLDVFYFKGKRISIVNTYTYLGVTFASSGLFARQPIIAKTKARNACARVKSILSKSRTCSFDTNIKLYESLVKSVLLYGAEIWGLRYTNKLKALQSVF